MPPTFLWSSFPATVLYQYGDVISSFEHDKWTWFQLCASLCQGGAMVRTLKGLLGEATLKKGFSVCLTTMCTRVTREDQFYWLTAVSQTKFHSLSSQQRPISRQRLDIIIIIIIIIVNIVNIISSCLLCSCVDSKISLNELEAVTDLGKTWNLCGIIRELRSF